MLRDRLTLVSTEYCVLSSRGGPWRSRSRARGCKQLTLGAGPPSKCRLAWSPSASCGVGVTFPRLRDSLPLSQVAGGARGGVEMWGPLQRRHVAQLGYLVPEVQTGTMGRVIDIGVWALGSIRSNV